MRTNALLSLKAFLFLAVVLSLQASVQENEKSPVAAPQVAATQPVCLDCPTARFPPEARSAKIMEGNVVLEVTVTEKGRATDIEVLSDPGHGFAKEAVAAVKYWKFKPALTKDGKKISIRMKIQIVSRQLQQ